LRTVKVIKNWLAHESLLLEKTLHNCIEVKKASVIKEKLWDLEMFGRGANL
jgi:hypothetical protein